MRNATGPRETRDDYDDDLAQIALEPARTDVDNYFRCGMTFCSFKTSDLRDAERAYAEVVVQRTERQSVAAYKLVPGFDRPYRLIGVTS